MVIALALYSWAYFSSGPLATTDVGASDKVLHALGTALLFLSFYVAVRDRAGLWVVLSASAAVSVACEFTQSFLPLRHFDWADLGMNLVGIGIGYLSAFAARADLERGSLVRVFPDRMVPAYDPVYMLYAASDYASPKLEAFKQRLVETAQSLG